MVNIMPKEEEDIYVYVHFVDIGNVNSPRANMLMIEKQDIFEMFEESTRGEIMSYELSEMSSEEFFPLDGLIETDEVEFVLFRI